MRESHLHTQVVFEDEDGLPIEEMKLLVQLTRIPEVDGTEVAVSQIVYEDEGTDN